MKNMMITTIDNPFNPFKQFDEWYAFDVSEGYNTCDYLARMVRSSEELSPLDEELANQEAINSIVELDVLGVYMKVFNEDKEDPSP